MIARFATHLTVYLCFSYFLPLPRTQKRRTQAKLFVSVFVYSPAGSFSLPFLPFSQPPSCSPSLCFVYYVLGLYFMCWLPPVSLFMAFNPTRATNHPLPNHPLTHPATHWNCFIQPDTQTHAHTHKHLHAASVYACALIFCRQIFCSI